MRSLKMVGASLAGIALAAGMITAAPAAVADNYAPQLASNTVRPLERLELTIKGAQPACRVTYSVRDAGGRDNIDRGLVRRTRVAVGTDGVATSALRAPARRGNYLLITRVDNFPGQKGCTPTKSVQRLRVA